MRGTRASAGFTLLEVLVAFAVLGLAVVTLIQLCSQGLRLLKVSGDHQRAVLLAEQKVREAEPTGEEIESGQEGEFAWERRVEPYPLPEELTAPGAAPIRLLRITVQIRWSRNRSVEVATLRMPRQGLPR